MEHFVKKHDLSLSDYLDDLRSALGSCPDGSYLYSLHEGLFSWKRRVEGVKIIRGQISVKEEPLFDGYDAVLNSLLEANKGLEEFTTELQKEKECLKTDIGTLERRLEEVTRIKEQWEKELYGQFVAVLNSKKRRIHILEEALDLQEDENPAAGPVANAAAKAEEDPFDADTDVDSDTGPDTDEELASQQRRRQPPPSRSPQTPAAAAAGPSKRESLRMDSFESPDSPKIVLPKRIKLPSSRSNGGGSGVSRFNQSQKPSTSSSSGPSSSREAAASPPLTSASRVDTQDLLDNLY